MQLKFVN